MTPKQEQFCYEYMRDLNGAQAAIRAGFSKDTAREQASRLLSNVNIRDRVKKLQKELAERTMVSAEMVVQELTRIGFSNIQDYLETGNAIADLTQIPYETASAVESVKKSITEFEGGSKTVTTFTLHDKVSALEKLGRHLGIFEIDNKQKRPKIKVTIDE